MGRPQRIFFPGALYHVTVRGNNKKDIFLDNSDRYKYLFNLKRIKKKYDFKLYCYVLMNNHVHLLIETTQSADLAKIMHSLSASYAIYFNKKYNQVGHLFQGRYHCSLIEKDSYLLELTRYIHLNPVRAEIVKDPLGYEWSSYDEYVGNNKWGLVDKELVLGMISLNKDKQVKLYKEFVSQGLARA